MMFLRYIKSKVKEKLFRSLYTPGHYYSPIPDAKYVEQHAARRFENSPQAPEGIALNQAAQLQLAEKFKHYYKKQPFQAHKNKEARYYSGNNFFNKADALALYYMMQHFQPKRIIEVGSGFSSALMLDLKDQYFRDALSFTFIEPFPDRLYSLFKQDDRKHINVIVDLIQHVDLELFEQLEENDILFIDSSHVSKVGSDVNYIFFKILPKLKKGVIVHLHDILYPFEYPKEWILKGIHWNEAYLLKSFLMYNSHFEILWFNSYLSQQCQSKVNDLIPAFFDSSGSGGSIYLRKVG